MPNAERLAAIALIGFAIAAHARPAAPRPPLEGQSPLARPVPARPGVSPRERGAPLDMQAAPLDTVDTRNATDSWLWVTFYDTNDAFYMAGCVAPREERPWVLRAKPMAYRVRAELTREANCARPVSCETALVRAPAMRALELQSTTRGCRWQPMTGSSAPNLRLARTRYYEIYNEIRYPIWITVYSVTWLNDTIQSTHCLFPQRGKVIAVWEDNMHFRAEAVRSGSSCQGVVDCDTGKVGIAESGTYFLRATPQACYWIGGMQPSDWRERRDK